MTIIIAVIVVAVLWNDYSIFKLNEEIIDLKNQLKKLKNN